MTEPVVSYDTNPTTQTYHTLNKAYRFFNDALFEGKLPDCLITLQRKGKSLGYFCRDRFEARKVEEKFNVHEIALNPQYFHDHSDEDILGTLVHEMCHLWQQEFGTPSRSGYHNAEWADKMEEVGLIPSNTGEEGGSRTGQKMSDYVDKDGRFALHVGVFLESNTLQFQDRPLPPKPKAKKTKKKYQCPTCLLKAWGKPGISLLCGNDRSLLIESE